MTFSTRGWVSVAELIVFVPSAIAAIVICKKHGFGRSSGWIYTLILCIVRIAGAVCQLLTYNDKSTGLLTAYVIIDSIGLSPLLLATLGMLSRLVDNINSRSPSRITVSHFRLLQLIISIGLILSIAGGTSGSSSSDSGPPKPSTTSKAGIALYVVGYVGLVLILLLSVGSLRVVHWRERRVALAVLAACPFILVRLTYSAIAVFGHSHDFNIIDGSVPIVVAMAVVQEFIVVFIYIFLGFHVSGVDPDQQGPIANRPWKQRKERSGRARRDRVTDPDDQTPLPYPAVYTRGKTYGPRGRA